MPDWVVVVKNRAEITRQRVFVENIEYEDEAKRLAFLKLGATPLTHEGRAESIDERVSVEDPNYSNPKELYEQALTWLAEEQQKCQDAQLLSDTYQERAERAEDDRNRLTEKINVVFADLALLRSTLDQIQKRLEKRGN